MAIAFASIFPLRVAAQTASIDGVVRSGGAPVAAANIVVRVQGGEQPVRVLTADSLGRFHAGDLAYGRYIVAAERLGYATQSRTVSLQSPAGVFIELSLAESAVALPGLTVEAQRERQRFEREAGTTSHELSNAEVKLIPGLAEADVLRAVEVLPGVVSTSDFSSAFNVRGGSADQNLILLDGNPIYNPFHLGGLFSVFNSDMVARTELLSGGFPPEYGTRVSSVLNVESDPGGAGFRADGGVSLLAARATISADAPQRVSNALGLRSARGRFSARRSYFDQVLKPFVKFPYHLTDVQAYAEAWTRGGSRISFTAYTGADVVDFTQIDKASFPLQFTWDWGNDVAGVRYTRPIGGSRALDVHAGYSRFNTSIGFPDFSDTRFFSRIDQTFARADADVVQLGGLTLRTGAEADRIAYNNLAQTGGTVFRESRENALLAGAYAQARWRSGAWLVEAGARADVWNPSKSARSVRVAPRAAIKRFVFGNSGALKISAGRYTQFVHSVRDEELPIGIDVWVAAGARAPVITSDQIEGGYEHFFDNGWSLAAEIFDRHFDGVTTNNFADDPNDPRDDLLDGTGRSFGGDLIVRRIDRNLSGFVTLSLLKATRTFPDFISGLDPAPDVTYPPIFDRRVDLEVVLQYRLPRNIESGLRWSFGTGLPYTRALGSYAYTDYQLIRNGRVSANFGSDSIVDTGVLLGARNGERYPPYHRLDVSFRKTIQKSWGRLIPYLDILNVYNRRNVLFYFYEYSLDPPRRSGASMFPVLPSIGVEVSF